MIGRTLIVLGISLAVLGLVLLVFPRALSWFGQLPGDLRLERENARVFIPLTSMLVVSLLLTLLLNAALWLLRKLGS